MVCLLKPQFAEEGTNEKKHQQDVYPIFLEFLNVVASQSITKFSYSTNIYNALFTNTINADENSSLFPKKLSC